MSSPLMGEDEGEGGKSRRPVGWVSRRRNLTYGTEIALSAYATLTRPTGLPTVNASIDLAQDVKCAGVGLYPTYPPLTKGRKQTPLLSGCSLLLAVLSFVNELLNIYNPRPDRGSSVFVFVAAQTLLGKRETKQPTKSFTTIRL